MKALDGARRLRSRFALRTLFIVVTVLACWLAYEARWIRQRHEFLAHRDSVSQRFHEATLGQDVSLPRAEIITADAQETPGLLWLLGEDKVSSFDLYVVVDGNAIDHSRPIDSYPDVKEAQRLFPEAQIVVGIVPQSLLEQDWGEPMMGEEVFAVQDHLAMLQSAFCEMGNPQAAGYLNAMNIVSQFRRGAKVSDDVAETRKGKFFEYTTRTTLPAAFFEKDLDGQLLILLRESCHVMATLRGACDAATTSAASAAATAYSVEALERIRRTSSYAQYVKEWPERAAEISDPIHE
jgi:hypothetical protein